MTRIINGERRFGCWPYDWPEDPACCIEPVTPKGWFKVRQCCRKRGHGPDGLYCRQHAKKHEATP